MGHMIRRFCSLILVCFVGSSAGCGSLKGTSHKDLAPRTLDYLAADAQDGRGIGTEGLNRAGELIERQFVGDGLKPLPGLNGYFQPFTYSMGESPAPSTSLAANGVKAELDKTFRPLGITADGSFDAPLVFAGYGIDLGDDHTNDWNDYLDLDVKGKAVLVLRVEPRDKNGNSVISKTKAWSTHATFAAKAKEAQERGAVAVLLVDPGTKGLLPFPSGSSEGITIPVINVTREWADSVLTAGGMASAAALKKQIDESLAPASHEVAGVTVSGNVKIIRKQTIVRNVVGVLPGEGPLADEYVVVGAHYDHLGKGRGKTPEIFHGAEDNASGTTAMLETAARLTDLVHRNGPLTRSVIFIGFTAEEEGLIGSAYFVNHPPVPLNKINSMVNLDMVGRVRDQTLYIGGGGTSLAFRDLLKTLDDASPLTLKSMGDGGLGPSDHMSFAQKKIPVLFFFSGLHPDYHRPTDTADKINRAGIDEVADLTTGLVYWLTQMARQPYNNAADAKGENVSIGFASTGDKRVTLGVVPDYTSGTSAPDATGVKIADTVPDSPAAKAGLLGGDVVIKLGATDIESLEGLSAALRSAEAGKPTTVTIIRNGKTIELSVTLVEKASP
ncbi:hypothetical protein BH10PLA1_BH10PLA1_00180 [soil metagenome]